MDDKSLSTPIDDPNNEQNEPNEDQPSPPSRLDRLMGAKDRAEKEAERWNQIEQRGTPLPSEDQDYGMTQPIHEPPRKEGDTPTGQITPPEGTPRPDVGAFSAVPHPADTPASKPTPSNEPKIKPGAGSHFPHPTDKPTAGQFEEPPLPDNLEQGPGGKPQGAQQKRYQLPPNKAADVRLDASGMPLPPKKDVPRVDSDATIASSASYQDQLYEQPEPTLPHGYARPDLPIDEPTIQSQRVQPTEPNIVPPQSAGVSSRARLPDPYEQPVYQPPPARYVPPVQPYYPEAADEPPRRRRRGGRFSWGCLARTMLLSLIGGLVAIMLVGGVGAIYYATETSPAFRGITSVADLQGRALNFETSRIRDRDGNVLYEITSEGSFRDYVTLDEVSPWLIVATVATEEREFFTNPGFSIPAILRAVYQNYREGEVVSGASTITQQLTRMLLLDADEAYERSYERKIKEIFLSAELGRRFSKRDVLELYLNQAFYGNFAYGIEAASQTYFNKSAKDLNLAEAAFLAGIPQAPAYWDPVTNKEAVLFRQRSVLGLMHEAGCIETGNSGLQLQDYCVGDAQIAAAQPDVAAIASREFIGPDFESRYPHWVVYIQQQLQDDPRFEDAIYTSGLDIYTTLDPRIQDLAQQQVEAILSGLTDRNVHNASVVVINPDTGAILAMVGSRSFYDETIDGQVNVALTLQQPGSSIKPFTYLTAFRTAGWTPATVIWDVPIAYEIPGFGVYEPVNYSGAFWGPVTVRTALSNSLNIPAVLTLDQVGVPALLKTLNDVGVTTLGGPDNPNQLGLSVTLGAAEVQLLQWTNAFAVIQRGGTYLPTYAIERIERNGVVLEGYPYQPPAPAQVIEPQYAMLIRDIMSDKQARVPSFGSNSPLSPPYVAGAKTGTTNDFRDNWTMGFTSELVVGVWVGNTDNSPMVNVSGVTGAGPIWRGILDGAQAWYPPVDYPPMPPELIFQQTVCNDDGAEPSPYCLEHSGTHTDLFAQSAQPPKATASIYQILPINEFNGLIANDFCPEPVKDELFLYLPNPSQSYGIDVPAFARDWLLTNNEGQAWATARGITPEQIQRPLPSAQCDQNTALPTIVITNPQPGGVYNGILEIIGTVGASNFDHYYVDFGLSADPIGWGVLVGPTNQQITDGKLAEINLDLFENGPMTIRVVVVNTAGQRSEKRVTFTVEKATPTPTPTDAPTATVDAPTPVATAPAPSPTP